jgi:hypothetical protein
MTNENELALRQQIENTVRRFKRVLMRGSRPGEKTTNDFVQVMLEKIFVSGKYDDELQRQLRERSFAQVAFWALSNELRRAKKLTELDPEAMLPAEGDVKEAIFDFEASQMMKAEVERLCKGEANPAAAHLLIDVRQTGEVFAKTIAGCTTQAIALALNISTGLVSNRRKEGISYLTKLWRAKEVS